MAAATGGPFMSLTPTRQRRQWQLRPVAHSSTSVPSKADAACVNGLSGGGVNIGGASFEGTKVDEWAQGLRGGAAALAAAESEATVMQLVALMQMGWRRLQQKAMVAVVAGQGAAAPRHRLLLHPSLLSLAHLLLLPVRHAVVAAALQRQQGSPIKREGEPKFQHGSAEVQLGGLVTEACGKHHDAAALRRRRSAVTIAASLSACKPLLSLCGAVLIAYPFASSALKPLGLAV